MPAGLVGHLLLLRSLCFRPLRTHGEGSPLLQAHSMKVCSTAPSFPRTQGAQERSVHRPVCSHREGSFLAKATVRVTATCIWNIPLRCDTSHGRWWSEQSPLRTQNVTLFSAQVSYKPKMAIFYLKSLLIFKKVYLV